MEWKEVTATEYCSKIADGTHDSPKRQNFGKYLITSKHIKGHSIDFDNAYFISEDDYQKIIKRSKVDKWDVIISMIGEYCGFCYVEDSNFTDYAVKNVGIFKVGERIKSLWLYYYLTSPDGKAQLKSIRAGSSQPYISLGALRDLIIPVPSIEKMKEIVSIFSSLDRKIELNNKINADLEEMAQAIFKNWFVDFEPFKDGKFVDSELGMIPEGWKVGTLGDFCNVFTGKKNTNQAIEKGLYPFFSCAPEPLASNDAIFNGKAIIIAGNGSYTGRTMFYNGGFDLYQRTYACTIREQDKENLMIFFYHMMKQFFEPVKMGGTRGSSIPYIVMGDITQQKFPYSKDWLIRFSNIANSMMDRKLRIDKENSRLSLLRDTLLPRLMSGELEVPE